MKTLLRTLLTVAVFCPVVDAASPRPEPPEETLVSARFVPEREDDFAWENDLIAFRAYGPALRDSAEDSGFDAWCKRVKVPIIDAWYRDNAAGKSYHKDHGQGADFYKVGASRGVGGLALVMEDGSLKISNTFVDWRILEQQPHKVVFELDYVYEGTGITETKRFTVEAGKRLFQVESRFLDQGEPRVMKVAVGVTTHDGAATVKMDPDAGWMACWETMPDGHGDLGTGAVVPGARFEEIRSDTHDESHVYGYLSTDKEGRVTYAAGYGWAKAGEITTFDEWTDYLGRAASEMKAGHP